MKKKEQIEKCKQLLKNYKVGEIINKEDTLFLLKIFEGHYNWNFKKGIGIESITVHNESLYNKRFLLNRTDGTKMPISYKKSIQKTNELSIIRETCRGCIRSEIEKFIKENVKFGVTKCQLTNEVLHTDNMHIDHYDLTFAEMFNEWIKHKDLDFVFNSINHQQDSIYKDFKDLKLKNEFIQFHNDNCKLRAVTKDINLKIGKRNYVK